MIELRRSLPFLLDTTLVVASGPSGQGHTDDLTSILAAPQGEGKFTGVADRFQAVKFVDDLKNETPRPQQSVTHGGLVTAFQIAKKRVARLNNAWRAVAPFDSARFPAASMDTTLLQLTVNQLRA